MQERKRIGYRFSSTPAEQDISEQDIYKISYAIFTSLFTRYLQVLGSSYLEDSYCCVPVRVPKLSSPTTRGKIWLSPALESVDSVRQTFRWTVPSGGAGLTPPISSAEDHPYSVLNAQLRLKRTTEFSKA